MILVFNATNISNITQYPPYMNSLPNHVAIICDGNRRWAVEHNLPTLMGHKKGLESVQSALRHLRKRGVHTATLWGFSTENWDRPKKEVDYLMKLFEGAVDDFLQEAIDEKVKLIHLGRKDRLSPGLVKKIHEAEASTKDFTNHVLNIALDYGGRDEIVRGVNELIKSGLKEELTEKSFNNHLDTKDQPYPNVDILIRTGGDFRLSGFMLWQMQYAELFFIPQTLPALTSGHIDEIIHDFMYGRERRFGGNGELMKNYGRITA